MDSRDARSNRESNERWKRKLWVAVENVLRTFAVSETGRIFFFFFFVYRYLIFITQIIADDSDGYFRVYLSQIAIQIVVSYVGNGRQDFFIQSIRVIWKTFYVRAKVYRRRYCPKLSDNVRFRHAIPVLSRLYLTSQIVGAVSDRRWGFFIKAPIFAYRPYFMPSFRILLDQRQFPMSWPCNWHDMTWNDMFWPFSTLNHDTEACNFA